MTITIPHYFLKTAGLTEREALIESACRLFDADRLDSFTASKMAGLDRIEFEAALRILGIAIFRPTLEDIADDIAALKLIEQDRV